jgi:hypothetical protein
VKKKEQLAKELKAAKDDINVAEADLGIVIKTLDVLPRAEKQAASKATEEAFAKLRDAKKRLAKLEALLLKDD